MGASAAAMRGIIGGLRVADNRDAQMTWRHRPVAADAESSRHPGERSGRPTGGLREPARRTSMHRLGSKLVRRVMAAASAIALMASIGASGVLAGGPPKLAFY